MSQAVNENGELIKIANYSRSELNKLKAKKYYCIDCNKRLILKVGTRNRPHFTHVSESNEKKDYGESDHHKLAINKIYKSFKGKSIDTEIEFFIKSINQRPDLVVFLKNEAFAFEFQASKISLNLYIKRTLNLKKVGFKPIWFLSSHLLKLFTNNKLKITPFIRHFINKTSYNTPPQLIFLNPEAEKVIILEHILLLTEKLAYVQKRTIPLAHFTLADLKKHTSLNLKQLLLIWQKEKMKFRTQVRNTSSGTEYQWRLWLYKQGLHFESLPSIVYLPTRDNYYFKSSPWIWQSRLFLQIIHPLKINQTFSYNDCLAVLKRDLIPHNNYPLIEPQIMPIKNYLNLLIHLKFIEPLPNNKYKKIKNIPLETNLNESIITDDDIMKQIMYNLKRKK